VFADAQGEGGGAQMKKRRKLGDFCAFAKSVHIAYAAIRQRGARLCRRLWPLTRRVV